MNAETLTNPSSSPEQIAVFDLNMARAFYACVFDAEADAPQSETTCDMRIGPDRFRLIRVRVGVDEAPLHCANVEDVDVSIARVATKGGKIISRAAVAKSGLREGRVEDPFGHRWVVVART